MSIVIKGNYHRLKCICSLMLLLTLHAISAESVNRFKNLPDKFWKDQEIIYNFRAEIYGTGNRSEVTV